MSRSMKQGLSRRGFLTGTGGFLLSIPFLPSLGGCSRSTKSNENASASTRSPTGGGATPPNAAEVNKRLIMFYTGFGAVPDTFFPSGGTETNFTLTQQMAGLAAHKADLLLCNDIDLIPFIRAGQASGGVGHGAPYCYVVGGWPIFLGDDTPGPGGISLDQKVAQVVGQTTRMRSLAINLGNSEQYLTNTISWAGANQPVAPYRDPVATFNAVFDGFNVDPAVLQAITAERKSVLDFVLADYASVRAKVNPDDQQQLDFHMQSVRDLETQLDNIASSQASCTVPVLNNPPRDLGTWQQGTGPDFVAIAQFQMDLIATALACDITRVVTMCWQTEMNWDQSLVGMDADMTNIGDAHLASHEDPAKFGKIVNWYSKKFGSFIQTLKDKQVFDNSLFVWFSENGAQGMSHSAYKMPYVLAGNAGGSFRTGRHVMCGHRSPNDLYITIQNAFGVTDPVFGDPAACTGPITALT